MNLFLQTTDLLGYEGSCVPLVRRTGRGEFLLNTGSFGIVAFVATGGSNVMTSSGNIFFFIHVHIEHRGHLWTGVAVLPKRQVTCSLMSLHGHR